MVITDEVKMPLSFSAIKLYEQCPHRFYQDKVLKRFPYVQGPAANRGEQIHKAFEDFIKSDTPLPEIAIPFRQWVETFKAQEGVKHCEYKMAMSWSVKPTDYFRGRNIWIRGQFDLMVEQGSHAVIIDYKTGKSKYADISQIELMALMAFLHFPEINTIKGALVFVDESKVVKGDYSRDKMDEYIDRWRKRSMPIVQSLTTRKFLMKPSGLCGFCPVTDCPHYRE